MSSHKIVILSDSEEFYNIQALTYIILFTDTFNINILIINTSLIYYKLAFLIIVQKNVGGEAKTTLHILYFILYNILHNIK